MAIQGPIPVEFGVVFPSGAYAAGAFEPVRNFDDAKDQSTAAYAAFFHAMLDGGVYLPPSAFEAWFVSAAHDDEALSRVADAVPAAARAAARALGAQP